MPPLPAVPSTLRISLEFETYGELRAGVRRFYSYTGTAPVNSTCSAIANDVNAAFSAHLASLMSTDFSLIAVTVEDLSSSSGGVAVVPFSTAGTRAGAPALVDACATVNFEIARRYRGGRPKIFLPFGVQSDVIDNQTQWATSFVDAVDTQWGAFDAAMLAIVESGTSLSENVNVSYYEGFTAVTNPITGRTRDVPKVRTGGPLIDTIVNHTCATYVGSQRRRRFSTSA